MDEQPDQSTLIEQQRLRIEGLIDGCEGIGLEGSTPVLVAICRLQNERDDLRAQLTTTQDKLAKYARHLTTCDRVRHPKAKPPCTCGYDAAIASSK